MNFSISDYVATGLIVALLGGGWYYEHQISNKNIEIIDLEKKLIVSGSVINNCKSNRNTLELEVLKVNKTIKAMAIDEKKKAKKAKKELDRLKAIVKNLGGIKSNDCKDIKTTLDAVRDYDYNRL